MHFPIRRQLLVLGLRVLDAWALLASFAVAGLIANGSISWAYLLGALDQIVSTRYVVLAFILGWIWPVLFDMLELYDSKRLMGKAQQSAEIVRATVLATSVLMFIAPWLIPRDLSWALFGLFWAISTTVLLLLRSAIGLFLRSARLKGYNQRHVLFVGANDRSVSLIKEDRARPEVGYVVAGVVDDLDAPGWALMPEGVKHLGKLDDFPRIIENEIVDEVVVCLPIRSYYEETRMVVAKCEEQGVPVRMHGHLFDMPVRIRGVDLSRASRNPMLLGTSSSPRRDELAKRLLDIAVAAVLLVVMSPVFVIAAIAVRLDSPGPILFRQERRGLNKRTFHMLKFRSMYVDAEARLAEVAHLNTAGGPSFKVKNDPRITRVGKWLRRFSVDELPQLVNVLKGEMSLVGPRPLFAWEYDRIAEPWVKRRGSVKPGLTGLWQVSGRSNLPFDRRIELDLEYIDTWSFALDIEILARTVPAVLLGRGAV